MIKLINQLQTIVMSTIIIKSDVKNKNLMDYSSHKILLDNKFK